MSPLGVDSFDPNQNTITQIKIHRFIHHDGDIICRRSKHLQQQGDHQQPQLSIIDTYTIQCTAAAVSNVHECPYKAIT